MVKIENMPSGLLGVNTYLVKDEDTGLGFIVDPGGWNEQMTQEIKNMGMDPQFIILTHGHADHIMGIPILLNDYPDLKVVANENEADMMRDSAFNMSNQFGRPLSVNVDLYVKDGDTLKVGNTEMRFIFTPGHSPGGMCIYIPSDKVLFSGDTLFASSIGRTDFPGCSYPALAASIHEKLWKLPDDTSVLPGHMGETSIGFEKEHNPFV